MINSTSKSQCILTLEERKSGLLAPLRRKTETIDWKKIASIDLEKLVQTANVDQLDELLSQIVYCRAEAEFDSENSDSGFLKVFKLSQIIIDHLLYCQDVLQEKYEKLLGKCNELENQKEEQTKEIQALKDTLTSAKRELRRRKELLASAQSEVIGDNKDEFDPCPYCSKKFLTTAYLLSHMQRRHQGLPLQPVIAAHSIFQGFATKIIENDHYSVHSSPRHLRTPPVHLITQETQTEIKTDTQPVVNLNNTITEIVERCLHEKLLTRQEESQKDDSNKVNRNVQTEDYNEAGSTSGSCFQTPVREGDGESVKKIMAELKQQLDLQWKLLSGKIQESGLEQLKSLVVVEPGEVNAVKVVNAQPTPQRDVTIQVGSDKGDGSDGQVPLVSPLKIQEQVEERLQKQENDLENLKHQLESKVDTDLAALESKLESQERYWRSKLRAVEEEYANQLAKLRTEMRVSMEESKNATPRVTPVTKNAQIQAEESASESSDGTERLSEVAPALEKNSNPSWHQDRPSTYTRESAPPQASNPMIVPRNTVAVVPISNSNAKNIESHGENFNKPVAKPRRLSVSGSRSPEDFRVSNVIPVKSRYEEEPDDILKLDQVEEYYEESEQVSDYSTDDENTRPERKQEKKVINIRLLTEEEAERERVESMRRQVREELSNQLDRHGLKPEKTVADEEEMRRAEESIVKRREALDQENPKIGKMRDQVRNEAKNVSLEKYVENRLQAINLETPEKQGRSPLVKMISAVKMSGKKMHKRVKSAITKKDKARESPRASSAKVKTKGGFFSRARWNKKKSPPKSPHLQVETQQDIHQVSEDSDDDDGSDSSAQDVEVHYIPKTHQMQTTAVAKGGTESETEVSSASEDESQLSPPNIQSSSKKKLTIKSNKAAKLRYRESRKKVAGLGRRASATSGLVRSGSQTSKKGTLQSSTKKLPVRRSLQAEFDNVTPDHRHPVKNESSETSGDATDDGIPSSWDEAEDDHNNPVHAHLEPFPDHIQSRVTMQNDQNPGHPPGNAQPPPRRSHGSLNVQQNRFPSSPNSPRVTEDEVRNRAAPHRPVTARPRIAMDSWDIDDESERSNVPPQRYEKPALVSQRWNENPIHENIKGKRVPMDVFSATAVTPSKPSATRQKIKAFPDSPLNNSWDSNR